MQCDVPNSYHRTYPFYYPKTIYLESDEIQKHNILFFDFIILTIL